MGLAHMAQEHTFLVGSFKGILEGEFDRASADEKSRAVKQLIRRSSSHSALLAVEPIPFLDTAIFTRFQHRLVRSIARLRGHDLSDKQVRDAFGTIRGRLVKPNLVIAAAKLIAFIPVLPELWTGSMAYALTATVGEIGDRRFREGRPMSSEEIESSFDKVYNQALHDARHGKRNELKAMFRNKQVRRSMRDLKKAFREGHLDAEETLRRSEEILARQERN
jgi:uncharacterized protein (DUF697 family)